MPVNIIDTLKPKNNGSFPIVEAVDVSVSEDLRLPEALEAKADASALAQTNAVVETKADASTVSTVTEELQGQINQIEISATAEAVVAPEVAGARVDSQGVSHETLKERADSDDLRHTDAETTIKSILDSSIATNENVTSLYSFGTISLSVGIGNTVNITPSTSTQYKYIIRPCKKGESFTIIGLGGTGPRLWGFTDSSYKLLSVANAEARAENAITLTPQIDGYFISNVYAINTTSYPYTLYHKYYKNLAEEVTDLNSEIVTARTDTGDYTHTTLSERLDADDEKHTLAEVEIVNRLDSSISENENRTSYYAKGTIDLSVGIGNTVDPTPSTSLGYSSQVVACKSGETFTITGLGGTSPRLWGFTDSSYKLLAVADAEARADSLVLKATQDGYFISNVYSSNSETYPYSLYHKFYPNIVEKIEEIESELTSLNNTLGFVTIYNNYYNAGSGVLSPYVGFSCTSFIKVTPGEKLSITTAAGDSVGVVGYSSEKVYNSRILETGGSALYPVERGVTTTEIIIPNDVYFITVSNVAPNDTDIIVLGAEGTAKENTISKMLIVPQNAYAFDLYVLDESKNKHLRHHFVKQYYYDTLEYGDGQSKEVVGADVWYSSVIADGLTSVMAGNFNFIHNISNMEGHNGYVGAGHGCTVADWTLFFADGEEIDPTALTVPIECERFDFKIKAKNYLIDKPNSPSESHAVPTLDENGDPIVTSINVIDAKIRINNIIEYRNRLIFTMDGIQFRECHGSMCEGYFAAFDNVIIANSENSWNYIDAEDDYSRVAKYGTEWDVFTAGSKKALSVTMFGDKYKVENSLMQLDGSRNKLTNTRTALYRDNGPRMKVYLMPVVCTISAENISDGADVETFNAGNIIDCISRREISFT